MKSNPKRLPNAFINGAIMVALVLTLALPVGSLLQPVGAQEATPEPAATQATPQPPTEEPTAAPTEPPTAVPTEEPTQEPPAETATPEATPATPEATPEPTAEVTAQPTAEATPQPTAEVTAVPTSVTPVPSTIIFKSDFQDNKTDGWALTAGWSIQPEGDNAFLSAGDPQQTASIANLTSGDFALAARLRIAPGTTGSFNFRAGNDLYTAAFDWAGNVSLYRTGALVAQSVPAPGNQTPEPAWRTVHIQFANSALTVTVDNAPALGFGAATGSITGAFSFSSDAEKSGAVALDDVTLSQFGDAPTATPVATAQPTSEPTEAPTAEATAQPTSEATSEVTPAVTAQPTAEATPEATATPTNGTIVLKSDFETNATEWTLGEGISIVAESNTNHALLLAATKSLMPAQTLHLADFQLEARVNIVNDANNGGANGVTFAFRTGDGQGGYALSVEANQTVLYRNNGTELIQLARKEAAHALNTWHTLKLDAQGGHLVVMINGAATLDYTDATPLLSGQIAFTANSASSVMLDDIIITDTGAGTTVVTPPVATLKEEHRPKMDSLLYDVAAAYASGGADQARAVAKDNHIAIVDDALRVNVVIWAAEKQTGQTVAALVQSVGGIVDTVNPASIEARLPLASIATVVNAPEVGAILLPSVAVPTGPLAGPANAPVGSKITEGFDIVGANDWHNYVPAGGSTPTPILGAGVNIAVIDTDFNTAGANAADRSCLTGGVTTAAGYSGAVTTTKHGTNMVEIICDIAPSARVSGIQANDIDSLAAAINTARAGNKIIVIGLDLGANTSPGDGTGGGNADAVYTAITNARNTNGALVIAAAGNSNGRYRSFAYAGAATTNITASAGDVVNISWNQWGVAGDLTVSLAGVGAGFPVNKAARGSSAQPPSGRLTVPASCGASCNMTLNISGGTATYVQVQVMDATGNGEARITGGTAGDPNAGSLARPADSPNALTIGAVCAFSSGGFPNITNSAGVTPSSHGPIFGTGGTAPTATAPFVRNEVKPDLVGPSDVSTSLLPKTSTDICDESEGFSGTSAAAAHIAGMAALLISNPNPNMSLFDSGVNAPAELKDYLQSHTADVPFGAGANGFDMTYGAGLTVLGNPGLDYDLATFANPTTPATLGTCASRIYVGVGNLDSTQDGSITNPYIHIGNALDQAGGGQCVTVLPGEYVTPIRFETGMASGAILQSYKSAVDLTSTTIKDSLIWVNNNYAARAGLDIDANNLIVDGFVFKSAIPLSPDGASVTRPIAIQIDTSTGGSVIRNNTITGFSQANANAFAGGQPGETPVIIATSQGVIVEFNTFTNNNVRGGAGLKIKENSGNTSPIVIRHNTFTDNKTLPLIENPTLPPSTGLVSEPVILINKSAVQVLSNRFANNSTNGIIRIENVGVDTYEVVVFSNLFMNNTNGGPIAHLTPNRRFRFINNTVAGHNSMTIPYGGIVIRGETNASNGDGLWEIHNNFFYNNSAPAGMIQDIAGTFTCDSISGGNGSNDGARSNWFFNSGTISGDCQDPTALGHPSNITTDPSVYIVGSTLAPNNPYQLRGTGTDGSPTPGIDSGDDSKVIPAALLTNETDVLNQKREENSQIDRGAYEFQTLKPQDVAITIPEDSASAEITLNAVGGIGAYSFQLLSAPTNYSTSPTNACGGLPVVYNATTKKAVYCPPANFYTQGAPAGAVVSFTYNVTDGVGSIGSTPATVTVNITPLNDPALSTTTTTKILVPVNTSPTNFSFRLRPYVRFNNFRLSQAGPDGVDYPYSFSNGQALSTPGSNPSLITSNIGTAVNAANGNNGIINLTLAANEAGFFEFEYDATDSASSPGTVTNKVRIETVGLLPDNGLQDDTSFLFTYHGATANDPGSWKPIYSEPNINNTLHRTIALNDTAEFTMVGTAFALYMQGSAAGGLWELQVDGTRFDWGGNQTASANGMVCRTSAITGKSTALLPNNKYYISNGGTAAYVVSCRGLLDDEGHTISIINREAKQLNVDAIGILDESSPLLPGIHLVTESQMIPLFLGGWTQVTNPLAAGQRAMSTNNPNISDITFDFKGTGFAIGTALQKRAILDPNNPTLLGAQYTICAAPVAAPANKVCHKFDNGAGATTTAVPAWGVYRPFFGFDPGQEYTVTIDITAIATPTTPMYIDSIIVFDQTTTGQLPLGTTEDDNVTLFAMGGKPDTWKLDTNLATASNRSLSTIVSLAKAGPFVGFQIPNTADTVNWYRSPLATDSQQALICVDRGLTISGGGHGNCILMNLRTGAYSKVNLNGSLTPVSVTPIVNPNPIVITSSMFRSAWGTTTPHTIEIFSLSNEAFSLDRIQVLSTTAPLPAGYYEENTPSLRFFTEPTAGAYDLQPVGNDGNFVDLNSPLASGGRVKQLTAPLGINEGVFFQFTGTAISTYFTFDAKADAVKICWKSGSVTNPDGTDVADVLNTGTCQTYDNQSAAIRYKAGRTIAGLPAGNYQVVVQMLDDQGEPALHLATAKPITMLFDAVQIYNDPLPGNVLTPTGSRYENSFVNRVTDNRFLYLGNGWGSTAGAVAANYSGSNYDKISNVIGAGLVFQTNNTNSITFYREARAGYAPMQICVIKQSNNQRQCQIIKNSTAAGYQLPISVPLIDTTAHTVTIVTTDYGIFTPDAVLPTNNGPLTAGLYDPNNPAIVYSTSPTSLPSDPAGTLRPVYSHWNNFSSTIYTTFGRVMQSQLTPTTNPLPGGTPRASMTFQFQGTGFSLITLFDATSARLNVNLDGVANDYLNIKLATYNAAPVYNSAHTIAGLPFDTYTVTITEDDTQTAPTALRRKFTVNAIQIYGDYPATQLSTGLYDDTAKDGNGVPLLTFGPSNTAWTPKSGTAAATYLYQTNNSSLRKGATVTFRIQNASGVTLFGGGTTSTKIELCAVRVAAPGTRNCQTQTMVGKGFLAFTTPFTGGVSNYLVSITNQDLNKVFYVDAIMVHNATGALTEGIYQDTHPSLTSAFQNGSGGTPNNGLWAVSSTTEATATDKSVRSTVVDSANKGQKLNFQFNGTGFSIVLVEASTTSQNYTLCVTQTTPCDTVGSGGNPITVAISNTTTTRRPIALTYVGFASNTYTVTLTNNDNTKPLLVDRVDILGQLAINEQIANTITSAVENTDGRIVYFPYGSLTPTSAAQASGGSQHFGSIQGAIIYVELNSFSGSGLEYVRQTASTFGSVIACTNALGTSSFATAACTGGTPISNTSPTAVYQKSDVITVTPGGSRWVAIRNTDGKAMPLDFVRPTVGGTPLSAGYYEETSSGLFYQKPSGGAAAFTDVANPLASGGSVKATINPTGADDDALYFQFNGTGFSTYFILDPKADNVKVCWASGLQSLSTTLNTGVCQIYNNQSTTPKYKAARTVVGLPQGNYSVAVQIQTAVGQHTSPAQQPVTMAIDAVQIYNDTLPGNVLNALGTRYETSFVNRVADNRFLYYGASWKSFSGTAAALHSGKNYDNIVNVVGAGVVFQTDNANALIFYRQTGAGYAPVQICAAPVGAPTNQLCTTVTNTTPVGYQQAASVPLNGSGPQIVSVITTDTGTFNLDAFELANSGAGLQPGFYEETHPALTYSNGGADWTTLTGATYTGGRARQTVIQNATLNFSVQNATGFQIGTGVDRYGGKVQVCYDTTFPLTGAAKCYTYTNEAAVVSNLVSRTVTGLNTATTYFVQVKHVDDGSTSILTVPPGGPRPNTYKPVRLRIDYVQVFGTALPPIITQPGLYNEDAATGGTEYLQRLPANRWFKFTGTAAAAFSSKSYYGVVGTTNVISSLYAGPVATLRVTVPAGGATIIIYTGPASPLSTNNLLVCANNVTDAASPANDCVTITDQRTTNQFVLDSTKLPALGNAGTVTLSMRALNTGYLRVDGFQVIHGKTLTPGIYDDFLVANAGLLDTAGSPANPPPPAIATWITTPSTLSKVATAYGGTIALATRTDARLTFDFNGTGFQVFTLADSYGVDMRLCYKLKTNATPFPANTVLNQTQPLQAGSGIICKTYTTDTVTVPPTEWTTRNGNQPKPAVANQYGFAIYGLANNTYTAEVRLVRGATGTAPLAATDRLKIDAIGVLADVTATGSVSAGQLYDNTPQAGIIYAPTPMWTHNTSALLGPISGPWKKTESRATNAGTLVQMNVNGNSLILYQTANAQGSSKIYVCILVPGGLQCSDFSQNQAAVKYFSPIGFFGFGSGSHPLFFENRDHGKALSFDAYQVLP